MRGDSWAGLALSQLLLILTCLCLRRRARETLPVPVLALPLRTVATTSEPDECEAGTGEMTEVVGELDTMAVFDETAAGVAPAANENVMMVSVVVVSLPFNLASEAFMVLRKTMASGDIRDR